MLWSSYHFTPLLLTYIQKYKEGSSSSGNGQICLQLLRVHCEQKEVKACVEWPDVNRKRPSRPVHPEEET